MDGRIPQPRDVTDSAQFVTVMRQLRQWANLSYRELERRATAAGDVLPRATLAGALNRQELPREDLVAAFVRACGGDEATVRAWIGARKRLAVELESPVPGEAREAEGAEPESA
ncbi:helix-turn-helix domain-containing protein, partial [Streptomyces sparsogenes]